MNFEGMPLNHPTANLILSRKQIQDCLKEAYSRFYSRQEFFETRAKRFKEDWELKILEDLNKKFRGKNDR
jgi:hypothetical protein